MEASWGMYTSRNLEMQKSLFTLMEKLPRIFSKKWAKTLKISSASSLAKGFVKRVISCVAETEVVDIRAVSA